jgi:hypothetical protein
MENFMHSSGNILLTPKSRVLLEKLTVAKSVKNYTWLPTEIPLISPNRYAIYYQGTPNNRHAWPVVHPTGAIRVVPGIRNAKRQHLSMCRRLYTRNHHDSPVDYRQSTIHDTDSATSQSLLPPGVVARMAP